MGKENEQISNSEAFECFAKGLAWLEQQKDYDTDELIVLCDRASKQGQSELRQTKLFFEPL